MTKTSIILGSTILLLASHNLFASPILLEKTITSGFASASGPHSIRCALRENGTLSFQYQLGDITSTTKKTIKYTKTALKKAINDAALGSVDTTAAIFPNSDSVQYNAYQHQAGGNFKLVTLGAFGSSAIVNNAPAATQLQNFLDFYCGD